MPKPIRSTVLVIAVALSALSARASAQGAALRPEMLRSGERLRIVAPAVQSKPIKGRLFGFDSSSVFIDQDVSHLAIQIPYSAVTSTDRSAGFARGRGAGRGALLGFLGGVGTGLVIAGTVRDGALAPIGFGFWGTIGGAAFGALAAPERWKPITSPR